MRTFSAAATNDSSLTAAPAARRFSRARTVALAFFALSESFARRSSAGLVASVASSASLADAVDLVVCLGGDGLVLHASSLFPYAVPPIACFNLGSMGFLANLQFRDFSQDMKALIEGNSVRHSTISGAYTMKTPAANFVSHSFFVIIL